MQKTLFLILAAAPLVAPAQTPAARMMPDGSRDMYIGLGVASAPHYRGAEDRDIDPAALLQVQWSNGVFLSGLSAGVHLSDSPAVEAGPMLAIEPGRSASGRQRLSGIGGVDMAGIASALQPPTGQVLKFTDIHTTVGAGAFLNHYLDESLRLTSSFLYGIGEGHDGLLINLGVQKSFVVDAHHRMALSAGMTWANRRYTQEWFGVDPQASGSTVSAYSPSSGIRDVQLTLNWNWELTHLWLLTSQLAATRLVGDAADSPYVDRRNGISVRTGLAYRF